MNPKDFENSSAGRCEKTPRGHWAFVPNPLPPVISYDKALIRLLSDADRSLGELSGTGRLLANPYLLISPYLRREAVSSSRIDGSRASLSDLFIFGALDSNKPKTPEVQEVENYVRAMEHKIERLNELPISIQLICETHGLLMNDIHGDQTTPGEIRHTQNWVGSPGCSLQDATYVPPPVEEMKKALDSWEKYLHSNPDDPPLIQCALMHYQLDAIHPFLEGNGRVGRLLITFFLWERGFLSQPLLFFSVFFDKFRKEYYSKLLAVSQYGDWRGWIEFFLRAIIEQAQTAMSDAKKIIELYADFRRRLETTKKIPESAHRLIDEIFINPVISMTALSQKWNTPFNSIKTGVSRLVKVGILREETGKRRNKLFLAPELMELLAAADKDRL